MSAVSAAGPAPSPAPTVRAPLAIARRALADSRVRTIAFGYLFAAAAYANVAGYRSAYPTLPDRLKLAQTFGNNEAVRLFYGKPYDLLSAGGYAAWRVAGLLVVFAAAWGLLAAVRAMRAEEDAGRAEIVLTGRVGRRGVYAAQLAAIAAGAAALWLMSFVGLVLARLPVGGSAYLALAIVSVAPVFVGVGALASQFAPTRRLAIGISTGVLAATFLLRVVADTSSLVWLHWATPLGWAEELRPFSGARPVVLLVPVACSVVLLAVAELIAVRRDVGVGLLAARDRSAPRLGLLGSPTALMLRGERGGIAAWLVGCGFFAFVVGLISTSIASAGLSSNIKQQLRKLGDVTITTPAGYIGLSFLFLVLAVSLYCCSQVTAARQEEAEGRLETLFALPVSRRRWLVGRLLLAGATAAIISLVAGAAAWAGAAVQNAGVSLPSLLEAGANCLPAALLFLALGALAFAVVPRASTGIAYGLVSVAFVWQLFGSLLSAPRWLLDLSPFQHIGLVPAQAFKGGPALVMLAIAALAAIAAALLFERRDLAGA